MMSSNDQILRQARTDFLEELRLYATDEARPSAIEKIENRFENYEYVRKPFKGHVLHYLERQAKRRQQAIEYVTKMKSTDMDQGVDMRSYRLEKHGHLFVCCALMTDNAVRHTFIHETLLPGALNRDLTKMSKQERSDTDDTVVAAINQDTHILEANIGHDEDQGWHAAVAYAASLCCEACRGDRYRINAGLEVKEMMEKSP